MRSLQDSGGSSDLVVQNARNKIVWGYRIVGGFLLLGLLIGVVGALVTIRPDRPSDLSRGQILLLSLLESLVAAYSAWSMYWGIPAAWKWWRSVSERLGRPLLKNPFLRPFAGIVPIWLLFYIPIMLGVAYGFFGGAFYEYAKCRKLIRASTRHYHIL